MHLNMSRQGHTGLGCVQTWYRQEIKSEIMKNLAIEYLDFIELGPSTVPWLGSFRSEIMLTLNHTTVITRPSSMKEHLMRCYGLWAERCVKVWVVCIYTGPKTGIPWFLYFLTSSVSWLILLSQLCSFPCSSATFLSAASCAGVTCFGH